MPCRQLFWLAAIAGLVACDQQPTKTDWLENSPKIAQSTASGGDAYDDDLSNVGHASHSGHGGGHR